MAVYVWIIIDYHDIITNYLTVNAKCCVEIAWKEPICIWINNPILEPNPTVQKLTGRTKQSRTDWFLTSRSCFIQVFYPADSWHLAAINYFLNEGQYRRRLWLWAALSYRIVSVKKSRHFIELLQFLLNQTPVFPEEISLNWFNLKHIFCTEWSEDAFSLLAPLTITMFSKVLWASLFLILSQRMEQCAHCAHGYDILRFNTMNQIILSDRWSDSNWIKESNFPWIIQIDHFLFLFERSTSCSELV